MRKCVLLPEYARWALSWACRDNCIHLPVPGLPDLLDKTVIFRHFINCCRTGIDWPEAAFWMVPGRYIGCVGRHPKSVVGMSNQYASILRSSFSRQHGSAGLCTAIQKQQHGQPRCNFLQYNNNSFSCSNAVFTVPAALSPLIHPFPGY